MVESSEPRQMLERERGTRVLFEYVYQVSYRVLEYFGCNRVTVLKYRYTCADVTPRGQAVNSTAQKSQCNILNFPL